MWGELVLYVGKTIQSLKERATSHRTRSNKACSKYIPDYMDWEIVLVDEVPLGEGIKWEQYYYDELMPLYNRCRPDQDTKEYQKSDKYKKYRKAYYQANKERFNQQQRKRRANR
jgi:hypothetical protein